MQLIVAETSLVVTGAWNPAILNPSWIARNVFDVPEGQETAIQIDIPVQIGMPPRIKIRDLTYLTERTRLILLPESSTGEGLLSVERSARRILTLLNHTPVTGAGFNFEFIETQPDDGDLEAFNSVGANIVANANQEVAVLERDTAIVFARPQGQVTVKTSLVQNEVKVNFNFHYPLTNAAAFAQVPENQFAIDLEYAKRLMNEIYELEE